MPEKRPSSTPRTVTKSGITTLELHLLDAACVPIREAFGFASVYLVGTAQEGGLYRDVDVRVILADEEFDRLFLTTEDDHLSGRDLWELVCVSVGRLLAMQTGMPVDFQIQRRTEANAEHAGRARNPLGTGRRFADGGDATPFERHDRVRRCHHSESVLPLPKDITESDKQAALDFLQTLGKGSAEPHRVVGEFSGDPSCAVCHHSWPCPTAKGSSS